MATQLTFQEHNTFHGEVVRGTLGATLAGALLGIISGLSSDPAYYYQMWAPLILIGLGAGAGFAGKDAKQKILRSILTGMAATIPALILLYLQTPYPVFSWVLAGLGFGLVATLFEGATGLRRGLFALLGIPAVLLGGFAALRFGLFGLSEQAAPAPVITALAGAAGGFVSMATCGLRRLGFLSDPVSRAYKKAEDTLRGELLRQASQAKREYDQIMDYVAKRQVEKVLEHEIKDRSKELCLSLFETAMRWQSIQGDTANKSEAEIRARIEGLLTSASNATDPIAKEQYERAAKSLGEQLDYLTSIGRGRERTIARIAAQLALLEKVRFSLVNFHATDSERLAAELRDVNRELENLTTDVDFIGQALREAGSLPPAQPKETIPEPVHLEAAAVASEEESQEAPQAEVTEEEEVAKEVATTRSGGV